MAQPVYSQPDFLDPSACRRIVQAMNDGVPEDAEVLDDGFDRDDRIRRATGIDVAPVVLAEIERALDGCREVLARFFGIPLAAREGAGLVRYTDGGFYAPHVDRADVPSWPGASRRAVAVVIFLNGSRDAETSGTFGGGVLRVCASEHTTIDIVPRTGWLVAFRADALHEVTPVTRGVRDVIVDWFYAADPTGL